MSHKERLDVIIIGAGTAGLAALREVRQRTSRFLIVNDGPWGTTCARVGCMPSKILIEAANAFHRRHAFDELGLRGAAGLTADIPAVLKRVRALRDEFVASTLEVTENLGEAGISGRAKLLGPQAVDIDGKRYETRSIILSTGSRPALPQEWQAFGDSVLTTDTLFEQPDLGPRVAVIGLGAIGVELAQALARLGLEVTAFSTDDTVAGLSDPQLNAEMMALLKTEMAVHTGAPAQLREMPDGIEVRSGEVCVVVDQVIAAMGRRPNIEHLGLETLGTALDKRGLPVVNPHTLQVSDLPVFLAGDANAQVPLLHEASDEGYIAGINALAPQPSSFKRRTPLSVVFSSPNIASVGQKFDDLNPEQTVTGMASFANQGRARAALRNHGGIRIHAEKTTGHLLGAELCAPAGEHMAHLLALAIGQKLTVHALLRMPFYHPTLEEGLRTALRETAKQLKAKGDQPPSDLASCGAFGATALD